jgi:hypothetical protein
VRKNKKAPYKPNAKNIAGNDVNVFELFGKYTLSLKSMGPKKKLAKSAGKKDLIKYDGLKSK